MQDEQLLENAWIDEMDNRGKLEWWNTGHVLLLLTNVPNMSYLQWFYRHILSTREGFLYLIKCDGASRIKIGFSSDPLRRLKELQTGAPGTLSIIAVWHTRQYYERLIHSLLGNKRRHLEWFEISTQESIEFISQTIGSGPLTEGEWKQ